MAHDRSDAVHFAWQEASQRLDYFLAGVAAALVAYVGQTLTIKSFGWNGPTANLAAVSFFCGAFYAGVKRIETVVSSQLINAERLYHLESAAENAKASESTDLQIDRVSGMLYFPANLAEASQEHRDRAAAIGKVGENALVNAKRWYKARNGLLIVGFLLLVIARALPNP